MRASCLVQFIALIGTVTLEIALVSRFWTKLFIAAWSLSYLFTFPFIIVIPLVASPLTFPLSTASFFPPWHALQSCGLTITVNGPC